MDVEPRLEYCIVPITDPYGPTAYDPDLELLVVSEETLKGGAKVNQLRKEKGLKILDVYPIPLVNDNHASKWEENKISSSSIRIRLLGSYIQPPTRKTKPYVIGLTGGIASGKTTICGRLKEMGAHVISCDRLGHLAYKKGTKCYQEMVDYFGTSILDSENDIDRKKLGPIVFSDQAQLNKLNSMVWPEIRNLYQTEIQQLKDDHFDGVVVLDAAILLEAEWDQDCNEVWVSIIPPSEAVQRIADRDKLTCDQATKRIGSQLSNSQRVAKANLVLCSLWQPDVTALQVQTAWKNLQQHLAEKGEIQRTKKCRDRMEYNLKKFETEPAPVFLPSPVKCGRGLKKTVSELREGSGSNYARLAKALHRYGNVQTHSLSFAGGNLGKHVLLAGNETVNLLDTRINGDPSLLFSIKNKQLYTFFNIANTEVISCVAPSTKKHIYFLATGQNLLVLDHRMNSRPLLKTTHLLDQPPVYISSASHGDDMEWVFLNCQAPNVPSAALAISWSDQALASGSSLSLPVPSLEMKPQTRSSLHHTLERLQMNGYGLDWADRNRFQQSISGLVCHKQDNIIRSWTCTGAGDVFVQRMDLNDVEENRVVDNSSTDWISQWTSCVKEIERCPVSNVATAFYSSFDVVELMIDPPGKEIDYSQPDMHEKLDMVEPKCFENVDDLIAYPGERGRRYNESWFPNEEPDMSVADNNFTQDFNLSLLTSTPHIPHHRNKSHFSESDQ
uniref:EOG090X0864 n=1 Tax=Evadne anonyx TaxID=141404 RepID=A0A9N6WTM5_9CRUS|nr:EOG090X0864 [Evadne anonyx]